MEKLKSDRLARHTQGHLEVHQLNRHEPEIEHWVRTNGWNMRRAVKHGNSLSLYQFLYLDRQQKYCLPKHLPVCYIFDGKNLLPNSKKEVKVFKATLNHFHRLKAIKLINTAQIHSNF